jgi:isoleucyl-tRNA synthetase
MDDLLIQRKEKEGLSVSNEGDVTAALDTTLTDELITEGWAREIVSKVQNLRKELQFDVADRIHVQYTGSDELRKAIRQQGEKIAAEVLALSMTEGEAPEMHEVEINGQTARFALKKA